MCIDFEEIWFGIADGQILSNFDRVICPRHTQFSFPDDNLSKLQWIFTKLGMYIGIVEIWFGIAKGKYRQILTELSARDMSIFSFPDVNLSNCQGILTKLGTCIDMK